MSNKQGIQVLAVTGGKGGVGKSNVSVNLGLALAKLNRRVALLDADLGLANIDVLLGLRSHLTLEDVLAGKCALKDILVDGPGDIKIIPASSGTQAMVNLKATEHAAIIRAFSDLQEDIDVLLIDTAAGIDNHVVDFVHAANEVIVVVCDEPSSLTDAYALIKLMNKQYGKQRFRVLANMTRTAQEGREIYQKLSDTADKFLDVNLQYAGHIPFDDNLRKAVKRQKALLDHSPRSEASLAFRRLADKADCWPVQQTARGHIEFFIEKLLLGAAA